MSKSIRTRDGQWREKCIFADRSGFDASTGRPRVIEEHSSYPAGITFRTISSHIAQNVHSRILPATVPKTTQTKADTTNKQGTSMNVSIHHDKQEDTPVSHSLHAIYSSPLAQGFVLPTSSAVFTTQDTHVLETLISPPTDSSSTPVEAHYPPIWLEAAADMERVRNNTLPLQVDMALSTELCRAAHDVLHSMRRTLLAHAQSLPSTARGSIEAYMHALLLPPASSLACTDPLALLQELAQHWTPLQQRLRMHIAMGVPDVPSLSVVGLALAVVTVGLLHDHALLATPPESLRALCGTLATTESAAGGTEDRAAGVCVSPAVVFGTAAPPEGAVDADLLLSLPLSLLAVVHAMVVELSKHASRTDVLPTPMATPAASTGRGSMCSWTLRDAAFRSLLATVTAHAGESALDALAALDAASTRAREANPHYYPHPSDWPAHDATATLSVPPIRTAHSAAAMEATAGSEDTHSICACVRDAWPAVHAEAVAVAAAHGVTAPLPSVSAAGSHADPVVQSSPWTCAACAATPPLPPALQPYSALSSSADMAASGTRTHAAAPMHVDSPLCALVTALDCAASHVTSHATQPSNATASARTVTVDTPAVPTRQPAVLAHALLAHQHAWPAPVLARGRGRGSGTFAGAVPARDLCTLGPAQWLSDLAVDVVIAEGVRSHVPPPRRSTTHVLTAVQSQYLAQRWQSPSRSLPRARATPMSAPPPSPPSVGASSAANVDTAERAVWCAVDTVAGALGTSPAPTGMGLAVGRGMGMDWRRTLQWPVSNQEELYLYDDALPAAPTRTSSSSSALTLARPHQPLPPPPTHASPASITPPPPPLSAPARTLARPPPSSSSSSSPSRPSTNFAFAAFDSPVVAAALPTPPPPAPWLASPPLHAPSSSPPRHRHGRPHHSRSPSQESWATLHRAYDAVHARAERRSSGHSARGEDRHGTGHGTSSRSRTRPHAHGRPGRSGGGRGGCGSGGARGCDHQDPLTGSAPHACSMVDASALPAPATTLRTAPPSLLTLTDGQLEQQLRRCPFNYHPVADALPLRYAEQQQWLRNHDGWALAADWARLLRTSRDDEVVRAAVAQSPHTLFVSGAPPRALLAALDALPGDAALLAATDFAPPVDAPVVASASSLAHPFFAVPPLPNAALSAALASHHPLPSLVAARAPEGLLLLPGELRRPFLWPDACPYANGHGQAHVDADAQSIASSSHMPHDLPPATVYSRTPNMLLRDGERLYGTALPDSSPLFLTHPSDARLLAAARAAGLVGDVSSVTAQTLPTDTHAGLGASVTSQLSTVVANVDPAPVVTRALVEAWEARVCADWQVPLCSLTATPATALPNVLAAVSIPITTRRRQLDDDDDDEEANEDGVTTATADTVAREVPLFVSPLQELVLYSVGPRALRPAHTSPASAATAAVAARGLGTDAPWLRLLRPLLADVDAAACPRMLLALGSRIRTLALPFFRTDRGTRTLYALPSTLAACPFADDMAVRATDSPTAGAACVRRRVTPLLWPLASTQSPALSTLASTAAASAAQPPLCGRGRGRGADAPLAPARAALWHALLRRMRTQTCAVDLPSAHAAVGSAPPAPVTCTVHLHAPAPACPSCVYCRGRAWTHTWLASLSFLLATHTNLGLPLPPTAIAQCLPQRAHACPAHAAAVLAATVAPMPPLGFFLAHQRSVRAAALYNAAVRAAAQRASANTSGTLRGSPLADALALARVSAIPAAAASTPVPAPVPPPTPAPCPVAALFAGPLRKLAPVLAPPSASTHLLGVQAHTQAYLAACAASVCTHLPAPYTALFPPPRATPLYAQLARVSRWTAHTNLFACRAVAVPLLRHDHWTLLVVNNPLLWRQRHARARLAFALYQRLVQQHQQLVRHWAVVVAAVHALLAADVDSLAATGTSAHAHPADTQWVGAHTTHGFLCAPHAHTPLASVAASPADASVAPVALAPHPAPSPELRRAYERAVAAVRLLYNGECSMVLMDSMVHDLDASLDTNPPADAQSANVSTAQSAHNASCAAPSADCVDASASHGYTGRCGGSSKRKAMTASVSGKRSRTAAGTEAVVDTTADTACVRTPAPQPKLLRGLTDALSHHYHVAGTAPDGKRLTRAALALASSSSPTRTPRVDRDASQRDKYARGTRRGSAVHRVPSGASAHARTRSALADSPTREAATVEDATESVGTEDAVAVHATSKTAADAPQLLSASRGHPHASRSDLSDMSPCRAHGTVAPGVVAGTTTPPHTRASAQPRYLDDSDDGEQARLRSSECGSTAITTSTPRAATASPLPISVSSPRPRTQPSLRTAWLPSTASSPSSSSAYTSSASSHSSSPSSSSRSSSSSPSSSSSSPSPPRAHRVRACASHAPAATPPLHTMRVERRAAPSQLSTPLHAPLPPPVCEPVAIAAVAEVMDDPVPPQSSAQCSPAPSRGADLPAASAVVLLPPVQLPDIPAAAPQRGTHAHVLSALRNGATPLRPAFLCSDGAFHMLAVYLDRAWADDKENMDAVDYTALLARMDTDALSAAAPLEPVLAALPSLNALQPSERHAVAVRARTIVATLRSCCALCSSQRAQQVSSSTASAASIAVAVPTHPRRIKRAHTVSAPTPAPVAPPSLSATRCVSEDDAEALELAVDALFALDAGPEGNTSVHSDGAHVEDVEHGYDQPAEVLSLPRVPATEHCVNTATAAAAAGVCTPEPTTAALAWNPLWPVLDAIDVHGRVYPYHWLAHQRAYTRRSPQATAHTCSSSSISGGDVAVTARAGASGMFTLPATMNPPHAYAYAQLRHAMLTDGLDDASPAARMRDCPRMCRHNAECCCGSALVLTQLARLAACLRVYKRDHLRLCLRSALAADTSEAASLRRALVTVMRRKYARAKLSLALGLVYARHSTRAQQPLTALPSMPRVLPTPPPGVPLPLHAHAQPPVSLLSLLPPNASFAYMPATYVDVPQQDNPDDCGVLVGLYAAAFLARPCTLRGGLRAISRSSSHLQEVFAQDTRPSSNPSARASVSAAQEPSSMCPSVVRPVLVGAVGAGAVAPHSPPGGVGEATIATTLSPHTTLPTQVQPQIHRATTCLRAQVGTYPHLQPELYRTPLSRFRPLPLSTLARHMRTHTAAVLCTSAMSACYLRCSFEATLALLKRHATALASVYMAHGTALVLAAPVQATLTSTSAVRLHDHLSAQDVALCYAHGAPPMLRSLPRRDLAALVYMDMAALTAAALSHVHACVFTFTHAQGALTLALGMGALRPHIHAASSLAPACEVHAFITCPVSLFLAAAAHDGLLCPAPVRLACSTTHCAAALPPATSNTLSCSAGVLPALTPYTATLLALVLDELHTRLHTQPSYPTPCPTAPTPSPAPCPTPSVGNELQASGLLPGAVASAQRIWVQCVLLPPSLPLSDATGPDTNAFDTGHAPFASWTASLDLRPTHRVPAHCVELLASLPCSPPLVPALLPLAHPTGAHTDRLLTDAFLFRSLAQRKYLACQLATSCLSMAPHAARWGQCVEHKRLRDAHCARDLEAQSVATSAAAPTALAGATCTAALPNAFATDGDDVLVRTQAVAPLRGSTGGTGSAGVGASSHAQCVSSTQPRAADLAAPVLEVRGVMPVSRSRPRFRARPTPTTTAASAANTDASDADSDVNSRGERSSPAGRRRKKEKHH